jgi:hypothetical protein
MEVRNEPLPVALPGAWSAEGRQDLGTITNGDTTSGGVCQIHCNVAASTCDGRKNNTVEALRNPDGS